MADKDHMNMIITGHIDNGKSTTMGHFLLDLGVVDERTIAHMLKNQKKLVRVILSNTLGLWITLRMKEQEVLQSI